MHAEEEEMILANQEKFQDKPNSAHLHYQIRDAAAAEVATKWLVDTASKHNTRLHICHLTTANEVPIFEKLKTNPRITTEVTPQHLLLSAPEIYDQFDCLAQINPPIRTEEHRKALVKGLKSGVISCVATDHAPHQLSEKQLDYGQAASGMPIVELSLSLMLNQVSLGNITLHDVVNWMCYQPTQVFNIPNKGLIKEGYDADLVLVDLKKQRKINKKNIVSKAGWSIFENQTLVGSPMITIVNGQIVYEDGDFFTQTIGSDYGASEVTVLPH